MKAVLKVFVISDGPLIHIPTGFPLSITLNLEEEGKVISQGDMKDLIWSGMESYADFLKDAVNSDEFVVNTRAVNPDFRSMYESGDKGASRDTDLNDFFNNPDADFSEDAPPAYEPDDEPGGDMDDPAVLEAVLKVHTMALNKNKKGNSKKWATAVWGVKAIYSNKTEKAGIVLLDEHLEEKEPAFWDNSTNDDDRWKDPYTRVGSPGLEADLRTAAPGTSLVFSQPMIVGVSQWTKGDKTGLNFEGCLQFDGKWKIK